MKLPDENLLSAYLDGELSGEGKAQFEAMLRDNPELQAELEAQGFLSEAMKQHVRFEKELPHADFFSSQIMEQIQKDGVQTRNIESKESFAVSSWLSWLTSKWLLGAATACLAVGLVLKSWDPNETGATRVLASYVPNDQVKVEVHHDSDASVILLSGLPEIPDQHEIVGVTVSRSQQDGEFAETTIFDENGQMRFVMTKDGRNQPYIFDVKG